MAVGDLYVQVDEVVGIDSSVVAARNVSIQTDEVVAVQTYTVPIGITRITVDAYGAAGGGGTGKGGRVRCQLAVFPGEVLQINVGGAGVVSGAGGVNGGGTLGGGGATDIRRTPYAIANRLVVAPGGGGDSNGVGRGGHGGTPNGVAGTLGAFGSGATQSGGGAGGGNAGALGAGGSGDDKAFDGAGGGSGYYGGGGGAGSSFSNSGGGGGGGSGLSTGIAEFLETGVKTGDGSMSITVLRNTVLFLRRRGL